MTCNVIKRESRTLKLCKPNRTKAKKRQGIDKKKPGSCIPKYMVRTGTEILVLFHINAIK